MIIGELRGCRAVSDDVQMEDAGEKIEMVGDSGCRRTLVKPQAFKGMKVRQTANVGKEFRTAGGAHVANQGETPQEVN